MKKSFLLVLSAGLSLAFMPFGLARAAQTETDSICQVNARGQYQDATRSEHGDTDQYSWGKGEACILRPLREIWGVSLNFPVMQWGGTDGQTTVQVTPPSPDALLAFESEYVVHNFITVKWKTRWVHTVISGTATQPKKIRIDYEKIDGTSFISLWKGSIELEQVAPGVTRVAMENDIHAAQTNAHDAEGTVLEMFKKFRTAQPDFSHLP